MQDKISLQQSIYDDTKLDYETKLNQLIKLNDDVQAIKDQLVADGQSPELDSEQ